MCVSAPLQYICLGYSLYEAAQLQDSWRDAKTPGAPLQVLGSANSTFM